MAEGVRQACRRRGRRRHHRHCRAVRRHRGQAGRHGRDCRSPSRAWRRAFVRFRFPGGRLQVKFFASQSALDMVRRTLAHTESAPATIEQPAIAGAISGRSNPARRRRAPRTLLEHRREAMREARDRSPRLTCSAPSRGRGWLRARRAALTFAVPAAATSARPTCCARPASPPARSRWRSMSPRASPRWGWRGGPVPAKASSRLRGAPRGRRSRLSGVAALPRRQRRGDRRRGVRAARAAQSARGASRSSRYGAVRRGTCRSDRSSASVSLAIATHGRRRSLARHASSRFVVAADRRR